MLACSINSFDVWYIFFNLPAKLAVVRVMMFSAAFKYRNSFIIHYFVAARWLFFLFSIVVPSHIQRDFLFVLLFLHF